MGIWMKTLMNWSFWYSLALALIIIGVAIALPAAHAQSLHTPDAGYGAGLVHHVDLPHDNIRRETRLHPRGSSDPAPASFETKRAAAKTPLASTHTQPMREVLMSNG